MKKIIKKYQLGEEPGDLSYWITKTPVERLAGLQKLREQYIYFFLNGHNPGFQRVYSIIKPK
jgi:hypothetical protein